MKENLSKKIKSKKGKLVSYVSHSLLIRHKPTKLEYTVAKILMNDGKPSIIAYRYYSKPSSKKRVYITIPQNEFKKYEPV